MTWSLAPLKTMSATEYFAWEEAQTSRHDFYLGEVFAMAGASDAHNTTALNIAAALKAHLRGGPCRVYMSDMRLELVPGDHYVYPDVMVVCDPRDMIPESSHLKKHPKLIVEVLSKATADYDLGRKFEHYRQIQGLGEVLFADPVRLSIELYRRTQQPNHWLLMPAKNTDGSSVTLESVALELTLDTVFENVAQLQASAR
jgi:Uma2 family endonuclease